MAEKSGTFEWVVSWSDLAPLLSPAALRIAHSAPRAIDVGCGTSELPSALLDAGYASVTAVDRDEDCVAHMRARHPNSGLVWSACDVCDDGAAQTLGAASYNLVFDKGMLDCALVEHSAAALLCTVRRLLAAGGAYAIVSFRAPELLRPLLTCAALGLSEPACTSIAPPGGEVASAVTLCVLRPVPAASADVDVGAVADHIARVLDWWYREQAPLLTPSRAAELRAAWAERAGGGGGALPLRAAFEVLLTPQERDEVGYDGFLDDVNAYLRERGRPPDAGALTLELALGYLEANQ